MLITIRCSGKICCNQDTVAMERLQEEPIHSTCLKLGFPATGRQWMCYFTRATSFLKGTGTAHSSRFMVPPTGRRTPRQVISFVSLLLKTAPLLVNSKYSPMDLQ